MLTLASDFGSPYPAAMRAAIRQHSDAEILDVTHDFPRQDVRTAAFWLREVLQFVPAPAVHCAVVDPTVGSARSALALRVAAADAGGAHALIAPDNGLVLPTARRLQESPPLAGDGLAGVEVGERLPDATDPESEHAPEIEVFEIVVDDPASSTFHGRDVFSPAAALIHERGIDRMEECSFLERTDEFVDLRFPDPRSREDGVDGAMLVDGEVLVVDGFGNAITNVPRAVLAGLDRIVVDGADWPVADHYAAVEEGAGLVTVGSHGNVELAVNQGHGAELFGVAVGDAVELRFG